MSLSSLLRIGALAFGVYQLHSQARKKQMHEEYRAASSIEEKRQVMNKYGVTEIYADGQGRADGVSLLGRITGSVDANGNPLRN
jgi:hypothetical protein